MSNTEYEKRIMKNTSMGRRTVGRPRYVCMFLCVWVCMDCER